MNSYRPCVIMFASSDGTVIPCVVPPPLLQFPKVRSAVRPNRFSSELMLFEKVRLRMFETITIVKTRMIGEEKNILMGMMISLNSFFYTSRSKRATLPDVIMNAYPDLSSYHSLITYMISNMAMSSKWNTLMLDVRTARALSEMFYNMWKRPKHKSACRYVEFRLVSAIAGLYCSLNRAEQGIEDTILEGTQCIKEFLNEKSFKTFVVHILNRWLRVREIANELRRLKQATDSEVNFADAIRGLQKRHGDDWIFTHFKCEILPQKPTIADTLITTEQRNKLLELTSFIIPVDLNDQWSRKLCVASGIKGIKTVRFFKSLRQIKRTTATTCQHLLSVFPNNSSLQR